MALGKKKGKGKHSAGAATSNTWKKTVDDPAVATGNAFGVDSPTTGWSESSWQTPTMSPTEAAKQSTEALIAKKRRKKKVRKVLGIIAAVLVALVAAAYAAGCWFFSCHFYPNSDLGGMDVSLKSSSEVAENLGTASEEYVLTVEGENGFTFTFAPEDAALTIDADAVVSEALQIYPCWQWPVQLQSDHDLSAAVEATYDNEKTLEYVTKKVKAYNKDAEKPKNATIGYDEDAEKIVVIPEEAGTAYDAEAVAKAVEGACCCMKSTLTLTDEELVQPEILKDDPRLAKAAEEANGFLGADLKLMLGDTKVATVNSKLISEWITVNKEFQATLSQKKLTAWVDDLATQCDTVGTKRTFTNPKDKTYKVSGGDYGWEIDHAALISSVKKAVKKAQTGKIDIPCTSTAAAYNGEGKPDWGDRYIEVNLTKQKAYFFDGDKISWKADIVSGTPDGVHDTPTGVYDINLKASPQKLIGYENGKKIYESKVTFWMPFDGNAIGFHDATWQAAFGGTRYKSGFGSHGCVNLSYSKAQELYGIIQVGDVVIVHK